MGTVLDDVTNFIDRLGPGMFPVPPASDTLGGHVPNFKGLDRDEAGIICQVEKQKDESIRLDGGDSAHRMGTAAFCNSAEDAGLLSRFESGGVMVRHPTQVPWNNSKNCTRDQLIGYMAGCWRASRREINARLLAAHATRIPPYTCQNIEEMEVGTTKNPPIGDPLGPDDVMFMRICAGEDAAFMDPAGQLTLHVAIEVAGQGVDRDINNLMLRSIVCGRLNLFVKIHPKYEDNLRFYWSGWRKQPQIAEELIWVAKEELKRYPLVDIPLLPSNLLNVARSLNIEAEFKNLDPGHRTQLAARFQEATLKDAAHTFVGTMKLGPEVAAAELKRLGTSAKHTAEGLQAAGLDPGKIADLAKRTAGRAGIPTPPLPDPFKPPWKW